MKELMKAVEVSDDEVGAKELAGMVYNPYITHIIPEISGDIHIVI